MRVRLDHPRHQRCAATVDHLCAFGRNRRTLGCDRLDAIAFYQHLTRERRGSSAIQYVHILEKYFCHVRASSSIAEDQILPACGIETV